MQIDFSPVIIIGAPRSGTNMLRDALTAFPDTGTWPCDEIQAIWRHGNILHPHDSIPRHMARPRIRRFIRGAFIRQQKRLQVQFIIEKTCANSLRLGFVDEVLPESKFIVIVRDGVDAAVSARLRWKASFDFWYTLQKAQFVPLADVPSYAARLALNRLRRTFTRDKSLATWGPVYDGMQIDARHLSLLETCMMQWRSCVDATDEALNDIAPDRYCRVSYERLVRDPHAEMTRLVSFLGLSVPDAALDRVASPIVASNVGKGRVALSKDELTRLSKLASDTLSRYEYPH